MTRRKPGPQATSHDLGDPPDELWRRIEPILKEYWPHEAHRTPRRQLAEDAQRDPLPDASAAASGTSCPSDTAPRVRSTTGSSGGPRVASSRRSGRWLVPEWRRTGAGSSGNGNRPTRCWARARFGGEKDGQESHRSRQEGDQEEPSGRWRRRPRWAW